MDVGAACMPVAGTWMPWAPGTDAGRADLAGVATTMHGNQPTGEVP